MLPVLYSENKNTVFDLFALEKELELKSSDLKRLEILKEEVIELVSPINTEVISESEKYKAELIDLEDDYTRLLSSLNKKDEKYSEPDTELDSEEEHEPGPSPTISKKKKKAITKLFLKVVKLCHPDKVGNSSLVLFYHQASDAYAKYDEHALRDILDLLQDKSKRAKHIQKGSGASIVESLDEKIENVKYELDNILFSISEITEDEFFSVMQIYTMKGPEFSIKFHKSVVQETIRFYKEEIRNIKAKIKSLSNNYSEFDYSMPNEDNEVKFDDPFYFGDN